MSGGMGAEREREERIRLLEFQAEFLRREVEFITKRHHAVIYSVAWRLAIPFRLVERAFLRLARGPADESREDDAPAPLPRPAAAGPAARTTASPLPPRALPAPGTVAARIKARAQGAARG